MIREENTGTEFKNLYCGKFETYFAFILMILIRIAYYVCSYIRYDISKQFDVLKKLINIFLVTFRTFIYVSYIYKIIRLYIKSL